MRAAFFDFDKTLIRSDLGPRFGKFLVIERRNRLRARRDLAALTKRILLFFRYSGFMSGMALSAMVYRIGLLKRSTFTRLAYRGLRGVSEAMFHQEMKDFVARHMPTLVYQDMMTIVRDHLADGDRVVVITTGLQELVTGALADVEGVEVIGCRMGVKDGRFTGRVDGPLYGADKANIIRAYCQAARIDLDDCVAYTDHFSDYHMLDVVGEGVCVHPKGRLARLARQRGWRILRPT